MVNCQVQLEYFIARILYSLEGETKQIAYKVILIFFKFKNKNY